MHRLGLIGGTFALFGMLLLGVPKSEAKSPALPPTEQASTTGEPLGDRSRMLPPQAPGREGQATRTGGQLNIPLTVPEPAGLARQSEPITVGVPLPREAGVNDVAGLGVFDGIAEVPAQFRVLSRWGGPVGDQALPIRWVLVDFQLDLGANQTHTVHLTGKGSGNGASPLTVDLSDPAVAVIDTGVAEFTMSRTRGNLFERVRIGGQVVAEDATAGRDRSGVTLVDGDGTVYRAAGAADPEFVVEEQGPMRVAVRITTDLAATDGPVLRPGDVRVVHRMHFYANHSLVRIHTQLENNSSYGSFGWDNNSPDATHVLDFDSLVLDVPLALSGQRTVSSSGFSDTGDANDTWRVYQGHTVNDPMDESQNFSFDITRNGVTAAGGDRHPGWVDVRTADGGVTAGVRWFWQNYEKALRITGDRISVELWPAEGFHPPDRNPADLYQFEGARHKSHEIFLEFHASAGGDPAGAMGRFEAPLIARAPPRWYYESEALGMTDPGNLTFDGTDDDQRMNAAYARYNELMRKRADGITPDAGCESPRNLIEAKEQRFVAGWYDPCCWSAVDWYGWAHFGDCAWGDGYSSNHYDLPGFLMIHFLRLGDRALWDLAEPHVRQAAEMGQVWGIDPNWFVAPISFYEKTNHGLSPERNRPAASHNWLRRLVLYYWLTGNQSAYDAALFNAEGLRRYFYDAFDIANPSSMGFAPGVWSPLTESRFLSWTLENALQMYALTGEARWMTMADDLIACLHYVYTQVGHIDGAWPYTPGVSLMSHYGSEPLVRFHHVATNAQARNRAMEILRGMITNTLEPDRVEPQGSGVNYLPAALVSDWGEGPGYEGPEDYDTIYNGFVASVYAYVGWLDGNEAYLQTAHRLWADGVYYPEYYAEYTPDPANRMPVDRDTPDTWGWASGMFPGSNEKVFARQTRAGVPYLWVMSRIWDATCTCGDINDDGRVDLGDFATFATCFALSAPALDCDAAEFTCSDLNGSGQVDLDDFATFGVLFATTPTGTVPNCAG